jgi:integrase
VPVLLTDEAIAAVVLKAAMCRDRIELVDTGESGLRVRAGKRGARWSLLLYSVGHRIRMRLGTWPAVKVETAREGARRVKRQSRATLGEDELTIRDLLDLYDRRRLSQLRRGVGTLRSLEAGLSRLMDRDAILITRRDITLVVDHIADRAPVHANRTLAYIKAFFSWAVGRGYLEINPAAALANPIREVARDRTPDLSELAEIWKAAGALGYPFGHAIRLLMLTASRRDEVGCMRVQELEHHADGELCWTLPSDRSKNGRAIRTALPALAREVLEEALRARPTNSPFVFTRNGARPISGWSKAKVRLDAYIEQNRSDVGIEMQSMAPWRIHDLRRSFATLACEVLMVNPAVADRCLNHVGASTTSTISRIYGRNEMFDQRRDALRRWAALLESACRNHGRYENNLIETDGPTSPQQLKIDASG